MSVIRSPFTPAEVEALNKWQRDPVPVMHPFTCPGSDMEGCPMLDRVLIATAAGWICSCGRYKQDWAHAYMAGGAA